MPTKAKPATLDITMRLRAHQEQDPTLGLLFGALHTFADRTIKQFFDDAPEMPYPVVAMERDRRNRLGYYTEKDGYTLVHRINLNPYALTTGLEAAETLAHEIVHLWQRTVGRPCQRNYHSAEFHRVMRERYGIKTDGKRGHHVGYEGDTWQQWLDENADLNLDKFVLPGADAKPQRQLIKWGCPSCDFTFRSRREDVYVVCMNEECGVPMEVVATRSDDSLA